MNKKLITDSFDSLYSAFVITSFLEQNIYIQLLFRIMFLTQLYKLSVC